MNGTSWEPHLAESTEQKKVQLYVKRQNARSEKGWGGKHMWGGSSARKASLFGKRPADVSFLTEKKNKKIQK